MNRGPLSGVAEKIYLIDFSNEAASKFAAAGYSVQQISESQASNDLGLKSVPLLLITSGSSILYQGGYAPNQQNAHKFDDAEIIAKAKSGIVASNPYPLFGCANGKLAKGNVDYFGLKYGVYNANK